MRSATIVWHWSRWATTRRTLRVLRLTDRYLVLDGGTDGEAWFERSTGKGCKAGRGGKGGGHAQHGADWSKWRLLWRDFDRVWVDAEG